MANISEEKWIEMLEKKADGTYIAKYPKVKSKSGVTFDEHLADDVKHGFAVYGDSIPANSSLTKTIVVGPMAHKKGHLIIRSSLALTSVNNFKNSGTFVTLSTDTDNNLVVSGAFATYNNHTAYSRRQAGTITTAVQAELSTGVVGIIIDKAYIEGENIVIVFKNTTAGALSLSCNVDWEVM